MTSPGQPQRSAGLRLTRLRPALIVGVALLCVATLIGLVVREGYARSHGTQVTLAMRGADPRDLVRGHYIAIRLADDLPAGQLCPQQTGDGWVALRRNGPTYRAAGQYGSRAQAQRHGDVAVRGSLHCPGQTVSLDIGIDRFYLNQREAEAVDRALLTGRRADAIVSVGTDGRARLIGIDVDGRRYDLDW